MTAMGKTRMLVIEDNVALAENIFEFFDGMQYELDFASDGLTALHLLSVNRYDIIILDVMLPGLSGIEVCRRIRQDLRCTTPVIMVTAKDRLSDKEEGFNAGADDYLVKPFDLHELSLRIRARTRRHAQYGAVIRVGALAYDTELFEVFVDDKLVTTLTGRGARIFEVLLRAYPRPVSHEQLVEQVWAGRDAELNTVRTHVYALRKQLDESTGLSLIRTLHGRGYILCPDSAHGRAAAAAPALS